MNFWGKAQEITKSVGKIGLAAAGVAFGIIGGAILTTAGVLIDMGPVGILLGLGVGAIIAGCVTGEEAMFKIATGCLRIAGELAFWQMLFGNNTSSKYSAAAFAFEGTSKWLNFNTDIIKEEISKIKSPRVDTDVVLDNADAPPAYLKPHR